MQSIGSVRSTHSSNKLLLIAAFIFLILCITYFRQIAPDRNSVLINDMSQTRSWLGHTIMWKGKATPQRWVDMHLRPLPTELQDATQKNLLQHYEGYVNFFGGYSVYFREVRLETSKPVAGVLFLHGDEFTSQRWMEMGTMHLVANMGFRAVAIDLPGFGNTKPLPLPTLQHKVEFMLRLLDVLHLQRPILVSQSESSKYALPFVMDKPGNLTGLVTISPTNDMKLNVPDMKRTRELIELPVMVVCEEQYRLQIGKGSPPSLALLNSLPNTRLFSMLADEEPLVMVNELQRVEFHRLFYNYLYNLFQR